ncbi:MAG: hypothetical protein F6K30_12030, partial [Cyanothece sp. SIO2G6]|nr:hypothetical protein [Cyanothece sp. SIO2G6]
LGEGRDGVGRSNDLQQSRAQVEATQAELEQAREELETIKSSKFWKLRSLWSRLKNFS